MAGFGGRLAGAYKRFRSGKAFLVGLVTYLGVSGALHWIAGYDGDWGATNLCLSIEASVATTIITIVLEQQEAAQRQLDQRMLHLLEAIHDVLLARRDAPAAVARPGVGEPEPPPPE